MSSGGEESEGRRRVRKIEGEMDGHVIQSTAAKAVVCKKIVLQNFLGQVGVASFSDY